MIDVEEDVDAEEDGAQRFATVAEARSFIEHLRDEPGAGELRRLVARMVLTDEEVAGDPATWHGFITAFISEGDCLYALKISQHVLERFPYDVSILGDAIQSAGKCGEWETGMRCIGVAKSIPMRYWDWYLAVWTCEFYRCYADSQSPAKRSEILGMGYEVIHACREQFPLEERLYNQEAEILIADRRIDEARAVLEEAIFRQQKANDGTSCRIPAPQCCLTYLDEILCGIDDYNKIIDITKRGIKDAATQMESVNTGYFVYREALALDSSIHDEDTLNHAKGFGNRELVMEALGTYRLAYSLNESEVYRSVIRKRFQILCSRGGVDGMSLPEDQAPEAAEQDNPSVSAADTDERGAAVPW